jgi:uncharacterized protein YbjT (DUF2867 family)
MPSSLLLLSRAFTLTSPLPSAAPGAPGAADDLGRVKETLLTLPEEVIQDVGLEVAAPTSGEARRSGYIMHVAWCVAMGTGVHV